MIYYYFLPGVVVLEEYLGEHTEEEITTMLAGPTRATRVAGWLGGKWKLVFCVIEVTWTH